jgi:hypothetical protein
MCNQKLHTTVFVAHEGLTAPTSRQRFCMGSTIAKLVDAQYAALVLQTPLRLFAERKTRTTAEQIVLRSRIP